MVQKCIRLNADVKQISSCKELIGQTVDDSARLSWVFSLLGSPIRFRILFLLWHESRLCVCDLSDILEVSIPGVSQHLRKLKDGGLVDSNKEGQTIFYSLNQESLTRFVPVFEDMCKPAMETV